MNNKNFIKKFYHWNKKKHEWTTFLKGALNEKNDQFVNEDTYQTLTELNIDTDLNDRARMPLWKKKTKKESKKDYSIFVATPVHSECSIHYTQALLEFQKMSLEKRVETQFCLLKSSLITQGRNLCVSAFREQ